MVSGIRRDVVKNKAWSRSPSKGKDGSQRSVQCCDSLSPLKGLKPLKKTHMNGPSRHRKGMHKVQPLS